MESAGVLPAATGRRAAVTGWPARVNTPALRWYLGLALVSLLISSYLNWHVLGGLGHRMIAGNPADIRLFMWYLQHDPWSVLHGHDPFYFATMNAPIGVNGMWNTTLLFPALVMTPVTLLAGPLASYNLLFLLGLAAGPLCAFPLLRRFARDNGAAAAGAIVFGFSPAVLAAGLGHLNLVLVGLMPVMLLLVHDIAAGRPHVLMRGAALGLAATVQLFTSEELLFQTGLAILVGAALLLVTRPRAVTAAGLIRAARGFGAGLGVFLAVCAGPLWLQLWGPLHQHGSPFTLSFFEADLRAFYVPPHTMWLSTPGSSAFAAAYGGGPAEYLAYLGAPLLLTALLVGVLRITDWRARVFLGTGLVFALLSLGGTLLDDGRQTGVRLPWGIAEHWPVFGSALPDRFAIVVALAAAGLLALGLAWLAATGHTALRILGWFLAALCVAPLVPRPYATTPVTPAPAFFPVASRWVPAGSTVLVLPYPTGTQTLPLVWQAAADMAFQMPGGYFIGPAPGGQAFVGGAGPRPSASVLIQIGQGGEQPAIAPALRAQFWRDMNYWRATAIVAGPGANAALTAFVQRVVHQPPRRVGGVLLWRHLAGKPGA